MSPLVQISQKALWSPTNSLVKTVRDKAQFKNHDFIPRPKPRSRHEDNNSYNTGDITVSIMWQPYILY